MELWKQSISILEENVEEKSQAVEELLQSSSGDHTWIQVQYTPAQLLKRPRFCNVCREKLSGFPQHGWGCDVCKVKTHKKCMKLVKDKCKWSVEGSIPHHLQYISPENSIMPHQWVEGNLSPSARCAVCEKYCGSATKLQDWRCIWCAQAVHDGCLGQLGRGCNLGAISLSAVPPLSLREVSPCGEFKFRADAIGGDFGGGSPLLVLVNSKSGDNQGQRMIRKFKRLLNPVQVFDIIATGPEFSLTLFSSLDSFRVLVCGGDGTVGWVLSTFDRLDLHRKCQLAVLPLGTGNDLARVLGWGHAFYNVHELPSLLQDFERAPTRMLDRWSVLGIEGPPADIIKHYEHTVTSKVRIVMEAEEPHEIIKAVKSLCITVRELMEGVAATYSQVEQWEREDGTPTSDAVTDKCVVLLAKLDNLMKSLEKDDSSLQEESGLEPEDDENWKVEEKRRRDSLVGRANSLKKALKDIMTVAERGIDQHYRDSAAASKRAKFRTKRSKTTPSVLKISSSNLSLSSVCSPPASPSPNVDKLAVADGWMTDLSQTSGYGISPSHSSNPGLSIVGSTGLREPSSNSSVPDNDSVDRDALNSPCIGHVQPPTPGGTREQSAVGEPDRPNPDDRLFKPHSECQLYSGNPSDIKLSHSDSSIYEHAEKSSKMRSSNWSRMIKDKKRTSAVEQSNKKAMLPYAFTGGSLIAEVLLLNARVLGMAAGTRDFQTPLDKYKELKTMNNYFGIGLDAKIALDFHNKREGSDKTRSRSKLFLWYGMLGGRELMHRTYRNLDQRIRLECDGQPIDLPSLQGIVILNIPSYSGGANFWGTSKEDGFVAQSFDDRLLEVVALFGVIHVATSRVPNVVRLQNHRIAQCRHVRIVILGNEPIPVQVDGEPWMQPPGILQIVHKNRAQLLVRNPEFDATLKKWEEQKERSTAPSTPTAIGAEDVPFSRRAAEFLRLVESPRNCNSSCENCRRNS
ncbi:unnamed protein product [Auanema sp. JU1783]|nr:unnamed protein product [Auanema sp. JU1783]